MNKKIKSLLLEGKENQAICEIILALNYPTNDIYLEALYI